jgi:hypothetical protein
MGEENARRGAKGIAPISSFTDALRGLEEQEATAAQETADKKATQGAADSIVKYFA